MPNILKKILLPGIGAEHHPGLQEEAVLGTGKRSTRPNIRNPAEDPVARHLDSKTACSLKKMAEEESDSD